MKRYKVLISLPEENYKVLAMLANIEKRIKGENRTIAKQAELAIVEYHKYIMKELEKMLNH